ncbi:lysylphosphatidylglycerol synthase transmembrane domain-containing protein [Odoribacter lunatus]|uniref:lysylphosphatidylglycerol synthase transmembrane domain-containing protein n=1 Tax=Odoribacter lunatus TaxID=2941335 RepID=UPI00203B3B39|nr:lysylphosphatidylglycerol synthase transmembrane domain-containing protein [Odoribacter lunatus]
MSNRCKQLLKFLFFLCISVLLFWLVYRDQAWGDLMKVLREDVNYTWVAVVCVVGILSHVIRALRWQLLTGSMGYPITLMNSFFGVMIGYFANLAMPRMGEFTRCGVVSKYEHVPFSNLLGTVVTERIIDMFFLLGYTVIVIVFQFNKVLYFLETNSGIGERMRGLAGSWKLWVLLAGMLVLVVGIWRLLRGTCFQQRMKGFLTGLKEGVFAVRKVKHKWLFVLYSFLIWGCFFLMFYLCFFCFEFTSHLGIMAGMTGFVFGSFGMVAPVQGGIGAWHFMVISALMLYIPHTPELESMAKTFALLTHGTMTLVYIIVGMLCVIALPLYNTLRKKSV